MMNENRADSFLRLIRRMQRGRLKIYLGYAAGVGKTYQMLLEAHRLKADGVDVIVGIVETHGRSETAALVEGLEMIPRRKIVYRGIEIEELDMEGVLSRHPQVVLIDELAHTNVPGSKNTKRYEDVEEILYAGIHVISTLNIQHVESLYETVEHATNVKVRERIPDHIVAGADQIVNVDLTPEDLQRRLQEGKVYTSERIDIALGHFFKASNLEQLRELTLRELAAQIDSRSREPLADEVPSSPDQVMVCLSSRGPQSEALMRYASRLAGKLNRNWYAVYVQTSREHPTLIDAATQRILANTLALAKQLGATVFTYRGEDVVKTILQFAREYRVGHIVIGSPGKRTPFFRRMIGKAGIAERLIAENSGIHIVVFGNRIRASSSEAPAPSFSAASRVETEKNEPPSPFRNAQVRIFPHDIDKESAMRELLAACCDPKLQGAAWEALLQREEQGGTFVGEETALPHARLPGIDFPLIAFGIGKAGIFDPVSGLKANIMILLISPDGNPGEHVRMLGAISKMVRNDPWRKEVLSRSDPSEILALIRRWEDRESV